MKQSKYQWSYLLLLCFFLCSCHHATPLRIACVGDSITYGTYLENPKAESYPTQLQKLLGEQAVVGNFGLSGATLSLHAEESYVKSDTFKNSLAFQADIVCIMLGTNDSQDAYQQNQTAFLADLKQLLSIYTQLPTKPHVYIITPCSTFRINGEADLVRGMHQAYINDVSAWIRAYADEEAIDLIDMHMLTKDRPHYFVQDGVHPNKKGALYLATCIADVLQQKHKLSLDDKN